MKLTKEEHTIIILSLEVYRDISVDYINDLKLPKDTKEVIENCKEVDLCDSLILKLQKTI